MPELHGIASVQNRPASRIAVVVSKNRSGLSALKWALQQKLPAHGQIYLIYAQPCIRWIPHPMGGKFPIDQLHPKYVEVFKRECFLEAKKLADQYRRICNEKKIKSEFCYSESDDSVCKELVHQISRLGITKLVLGMSSRNVIARALRKESVSSYVAKHAPGFCEVSIVKKENLCHLKKAQSPPFSLPSSPTSEVTVSETNMGSDGDESSDMQNTSPEVSHTVASRAALDFSQTYSEQPSSYRISGNRTHHNLLMDMIPDHIAPLTSQYLTCSPSTPFGSFWNQVDCSISNLHDRLAETSQRSQFPPLCEVSTINGAEIMEKQRPCQQRPTRGQENIFEGSNLSSADDVVVTHERHQVEALNIGNKAMKQATKEVGGYEEALTKLQCAQRDHELTQQRLFLEVENHQKTQMELEMQKMVAEAYATESVLAKQQAQAEKYRCIETIVKLEDLTRKLEMECHLRREAEDRATLEATEKLDALAALRKERQTCLQYSYEELKVATNCFNEGNKVGEDGYGALYKGKLRHTPVAIKVLDPKRLRGCEEFQREVELLSRMHHPHLLMLLGVCPNKVCIVYEYMANGSLEDCLNCKNGTPPLPWYTRFRICFEVATALLFLHSQPQPIAHGDLKLANILLDHHFGSKIGDIGLARLVPHNSSFSSTHDKDSACNGTSTHIDPEYQRTGALSSESADVFSLGIIMLQLLTARPAIGVIDLVEDAEREGKLQVALDKSAGEWPLQAANELARISLQCCGLKRVLYPELEKDILPALESIQNVAELAMANMRSVRPFPAPIVPSSFFCPIFQEIMKDPHMAADGFTYEHSAIKVWLQANNTSPMTNLRLDHKNLTPNHNLRSAIREWHDNGLIRVQC